MTTRPLTRHALQRLRQVWRSAGWPFQDTVEAELLAGGWLERRWDTEQRVTVHLTAHGIEALTQSAAINRRRMSAHELLVDRVAHHLNEQGRIVWSGLMLRAKPAAPGEPGEASDMAKWMAAIPDVFSIRHTSRPEYLDPMAHEIKVSRADLLSDLRKPAKAAAYRGAAGACSYVIQEGIAEPDEIPLDFGVLVAQASGELVTARPAPRVHHTLPFATWMTLARAAPCVFDHQQPGELQEADA